MYPRILFLCYVALLMARPLQAQIRLPDGNTLQLVSGSNLLYLETRILFTTGKYKADDYRWLKISDSLDSRWLVTACFNGDCRNDLVPSGQFIKDFGLNDTTCFIAFHVETMNFDGTSRIQYKVINTRDTTDQALLTYRITYSRALGTALVTSVTVSPTVYPNPFTTSLQVNHGMNTGEPMLLSLMSMEGKTLASFILNESATSLPVTSFDLHPGMYLLRWQQGSQCGVLRLLKQ